ncbi:MAG: glutamate racemase [Candidatus Firestonebacteria bacterium]
MKNERAIGIFDSGLGGLSVMKEVIARLPQENIVYLGDTKHVPYGSKSKSTVTRLSTQNIEQLLKKNVKLIVIACNTSSALSLPALKKIFTVPLIGVVVPGAKAGSALTKNGRIGVIGTRGTVESGAYVKAIHKFNPRLKVFSKACPLFVPLVEEGWLDNTVTSLVSREYLAGFKKEGIDSLVLGCTHYPFLKDSIQKVLKGVKLVDSATETAKTVAGELASLGILRTCGNKPKYRFYVTDAPEKFKKMGSVLLKQKINKVKLLNVE